MSGTIVYKGTLSNGVDFEIHQSDGFSNNSGIAIKMSNEFVSILNVNTKRNGTIEINPSIVGKITIKKSKDEIADEEIQNQKPGKDLLSGMSPIVSSDVPKDLLSGVSLLPVSNTTDENFSDK